MWFSRVRGVLGSMLIFAENIGIVASYLMGNFCDYNVAPGIAIGLSIIFGLSFAVFPETPAYLMKQNEVIVCNEHEKFFEISTFVILFRFILKQAERSLKFYQNIRSQNGNSKLFANELNRLKNLVNDGKIEQIDENSWKLKDLLERPGRNALIIGLALSMLYSFCGIFAMLNYTVVIFKEAESMFDPNIVPIVVGVIQLAGSYIATILSDRIGRKVI